MTAPAGTPLGARLAAADPLPADVLVAAGLTGVVRDVLDLVLGRLAVLLRLAVVLRAGVLRPTVLPRLVVLPARVSAAVLLLLAVLRLAVVGRLGVLLLLAVLRLAVVGRLGVPLLLAVLRLAVVPRLGVPLLLAVLRLAVVPRLGVLRPAPLLRPAVPLERLVVPLERLAVLLVRLAVLLVRLAVLLVRLAVVRGPWRADPVFLAAAAGLSGCVISLLPPLRAYPGQGRRPLRTYTHPAWRPARHPWGMTTISARPASLARTAFARGYRGPAHAGTDRRVRTRR